MSCNKIKYGGHQREDIPHYHNRIKLPSGKTMDLSPAEHCISSPELPIPIGKTHTGATCAVKSYKLQNLFQDADYFIPPGRPFTIFIGINEDNDTQTGPLTYFRIASSDDPEGIHGLPFTTKLRDIRFEKEGELPKSLRRSWSLNPFIAVYNDEFTLPKNEYLHHHLQARIAMEEEKNPMEPTTPDMGLGRMRYRKNRFTKRKSHINKRTKRRRKRVSNRYFRNKNK
jgi:hypothetical protein